MIRHHTAASAMVNYRQDSAVVIATALTDTNVTSMGSNNNVDFNANLLKNKGDNHVWIDAIRFQLVQNGAGLTEFLEGAAEVRIYAGRQELTRNWTPLSVLCGVQDRADAINAFTAGTVSGNAIFGPTLNGAMGLCTWYLPKPLFYPRGEVISITLRNNDTAGNGNTGTLTSQTAVALIGRETVEEPAQVEVPYATPYVSPTQTYSATVGFRFSTPTGVLGNPNSRPLLTTKLCAAIARNRTSGTGVIWSELIELGAPSTTSSLDLVSAQIVRSSGNPAQSRNFTARDFVSWGALFPPQTRELILNTVLPARSAGFVVNVYGSKNINAINGNYQFQFCLHGYYKTPIGELWSSMANRDSMHHRSER